MDNILNSEVAWKEFHESVADPVRNARESRRYIRLNPDLKIDPPRLDAKEELLNLQQRVRNELKSQKNQEMIEQIVHRLVASSFYFKKMRPKQDEDSDRFTCIGKLDNSTCIF
jgi:type VI protein secretion system component VasF